MPKQLTKTQLASIIKKIDRHKDAIAKHRDALRDIYQDLESCADSANEGVQLLSAAVDELSQYM